MLAPLLALCLSPPSTSSPGVTDESVIYEPAPREAIEPVEVTPPPPEPAPPLESEPAPELAPTPAPVLEPPLPAPEPPPLPPPPPPPTGAGRLVGSGFSIALGLAALAVVPIELTRDTNNTGNPSYVAATFVPLGIAGVAIGAYLMHKGLKARANFNEWRAYSNAQPRPSGEGLLVAGVMSSVIGGVTLLGAAVAAGDAPDGPLVPISFAVGGTFVAVGVGTLTAGLLRRNRYSSWRAGFTSALPRWSPPIVAPLRGGVGVGWSVRF